MKDKIVQYKTAGIPHELQAAINMIDVFVARRACKIWSLHKHNTNFDMSLATCFCNMPASGVFEN